MNDSAAQAGLLTKPVVRCAFTAMYDPRVLKPHPANPNKHPPKQLELFVSILAFQGWRRPITVSAQSGYVTKGHGALEAALLAGYSEVPVDVQNYDSLDAEHADIVADNQLQRLSEMDATKLTELLVHLNSGDFNMELTGLPETKLTALLTGFDAPPAPGLSGGEGAPTVGPSAPGGPVSDGSEPPPPSQVRMVQLFFNEETQREFADIVAFFQGEIKTENTTDTVLEILRSAFAAHTAEAASA